MDVLMLFGIVINDMRTSGCHFSMRPTMTFLDEKFIVLSMIKV